VAETLGLKRDHLMRCYTEAMGWAEDALKHS
jgi:hypothetical protein